MFRVTVDKVAKPQEVPVGITGGTPLPASEGANFFHFTVLGPEVQMLVGTVNLLQLHEAKQTGSQHSIVPEITHRFLLSPVGFTALRAQIAAVEKAVPDIASIVAEAKKP